VFISENLWLLFEVVRCGSLCPGDLVANLYCLLTFKKLALTATTTVLIDISIAPTVGEMIILILYNTPAARGIAITLYPVAQKRF